MFLSESNFKRAGDFIPERWLGAAEFKEDRRDCFNPFGLGSLLLTQSPAFWSTLADIS